MLRQDNSMIRDLLKQEDVTKYEIAEEKVNFSYFGDKPSYLETKNLEPIRVSIYGDYPHFEKATAYFMLKKAGVIFGERFDAEKKWDIGWFWDPRITLNKGANKIRERSKKIKMINLFLQDTSKNFVAESVEQHFGYTFKIDPNTYQGYCIAKHNGNGTKSCFFLKCPINADEIFHDHCYQKIINFSSKTEEGVLNEIRVPIFKNIIPFAFFKRRSKGLRFTSKNRSMKIGNPLEYLSEEECKNIISYCNKIGLEYGELDILRCDESGLIYIIDVNNTPWWPPNNLSDTDRNISLNLMWNAFLEAFLPDKFQYYHVPDENIDDFVNVNKPRERLKISYNALKYVSTVPYEFNYKQLLERLHRVIPAPKKPSPKKPAPKKQENQGSVLESIVNGFIDSIKPFSI